LRADLEMVAGLEGARLRMAAFRDNHYDWDGANAAYATAFRAYRLDVEGLDPRKLADQIRTAPIRPQLAAALDLWAYVRRELKIEGWERLVAAARAADPDPDAGRNQLRDALEGQDPQAR
jgi:hypothetical protein